MADEVLRSIVSIPRDTVLPKDQFVNTFHWLWDNANGILSTPLLAAGEISARLTTFYDAIDAEMGGQAAAGVTCRVYRLSDPPPRLPVAVLGMNRPAPTASGLPSELAAVITWQAAIASGENPMRRRGRTYIGPMSASGLITTGGDVYITTPVVNVLAAAADALITNQANGLRLAVYSEADGVARVITNGWVDNAYDIQRKRGAAPTVRTPFAV